MNRFIFLKHKKIKYFDIGIAYKKTFILCSLFLCHFLSNGQDQKLSIPSIFSPKNNELNDKLYISGTGVKQITFMIFNRWGESVFESNDLSIGWDGTFKGKPVENGTYFYSISGKFKDDSKIDQKGTITYLSDANGKKNNFKEKRNPVIDQAASSKMNLYGNNDKIDNQVKSSELVINSTSIVKTDMSIAEKAKQNVEQKINEWQQKGEFEKVSDYKLRVNENTRKQKIDKFQVDAVIELKRQYSESVNFKDIKLGIYDAENECFLLSSSMLNEFVVPVKQMEAPDFKQNFSSMKFQNPDFAIINDKFVLSRLEINGLDNKNYFYDSKNTTTYSLTKIDYKFDDIQVNVEDKNTTNNNKIQKSSSIITVGKSDVDFNIPAFLPSKTNTYALIIGNEDYSSFQTELNVEVNVDFAINDAKMFKEYCNKTLGIPEKQIKILTNATSGQMNQGISWLNNLAKIDNGNAELIFYYSGHGLPDEETKESYLMPVDISGSNVNQAIKLANIYNRLNEYPSKKVLVLLDACFSGGARNQGLISMKGVKIKPKENMVTGNMIVISSSSGEESSGVYRDKQHGFMTYFLLKKIQESKGDISYKELADYIIENVKKETALNGKNQTPQLNYSPNIENSWTNWKIK
jgi:gliding motility-associated-like protein